MYAPAGAWRDGPLLRCVCVLFTGSGLRLRVVSVLERDGDPPGGRSDLLAHVLQVHACMHAMFNLTVPRKRSVDPMLTSPKFHHTPLGQV